MNNTTNNESTIVPAPCGACCSVRKQTPPEKPLRNEGDGVGGKTILGRILDITGIFATVRARLLLAAISAAALLASMFSGVNGMFPFHLGWIAIILCGTPLLISAVMAITKRRINAEVLVSTAIIATICIDQIFAGGEVAFIMAVGHLLENWTINRARAGIEKLVKLTPKTARRISDGTEEIVEASEIRIGETLRVLPGEHVPVDGVIMSGETSIDQQLMTGEPLPVDRGGGDEVFAGTINRFGAFTMRAGKIGEDSTLARMIRLVREAEMKKAPMERITDRAASILVPLAILTAVIVGIATQDLIRAVTILVVFCPCSLVLATPTAIVAAIGNASRYGIIIRSGEALESLGKIAAIAFDKTGTLTKGEPELQAAVSLCDYLDDNELLALSASLEKESQHPLSRCIVAAADEKSLGYDSLSEARIVPGRGMIGETGSGETLLIGNEKMMRENNIVLPENDRDRAEPYFRQGATVVWVALRSRLAGFLAISDTLRDTAKDTVSKLRNSRLDVMLLTGDNDRSAGSIARKLGIEKVHSELLPEDKQKIIARLVESGTKIGMVGDGINDAPALKSANVGIAMGKMGSDLAVEAADVVLIGDDISRVPFLVRLSRKTVSTIFGNIALSMSINFVAVIFAGAGCIDPAIGALIHNAGSLLVTLNASLLLGVRLKEKD